MHGGLGPQCGKQDGRKDVIKKSVGHKWPKQARSAGERVYTLWMSLCERGKVFHSHQMCTCITYKQRTCRKRHRIQLDLADKAALGLRIEFPKKDGLAAKVDPIGEDTKGQVDSDIGTYNEAADGEWAPPVGVAVWGGEK